MAEKPDKKQQPVDKELVVSRYPIEELMANAEALFSVRPEVVVGAFHGIKAAELSVTEAQGLVNTFLEKKVI